MTAPRQSDFNTVFNNPALVQTASVGSGNIADLPSQQSSFGSGVLGNILGAAKNGKVPTVYSFSLGVQHEIAKGTTFDVAYVGTMSRHLVTARDINTIPYGYAFTLAAQDPNACGWNGTVGTDPNLLPSTLQPVSVSAESAPWDTAPIPTHL